MKTRRLILALILSLSYLPNAVRAGGEKGLFGEDIDQAEAGAVPTYKADLQRALAKNEDSLRAVLRLSVKSAFDGVGSLSYSSRLAHLLDIWGDHSFARVLNTETAEVKKAVIERLDNYAIDQFIRKYPETSALAEHRSG